MAQINKFSDLKAWQESHKITLHIYKITNKFPKSETFGLTSQIRRAAVSIESNIAEGFARYHYKDRLKFYFEARGSLSEVQSQLITAKDLGYITENKFVIIYKQTEAAEIILGGLIRSTRNLISKNF